MSRDKPDSDNRCIMIDLSWPAEAPVNYFTKANVHLNSVYKESITSQTLLRLGSEAVIYKIDFSPMFRQLRIDLHDYNLLANKWGSHNYIDRFCPFGSMAEV